MDGDRALLRASSPTGFTEHQGFSIKRSASRGTFTENSPVPRSYLSAEEEEAQKKFDGLWELMGTYLANDIHSIQRSIVNHIEYTLACTRFNFDAKAAYLAAAYSIRDRLIESWNDTQQYHTEKDAKRVYYLSLEFLLGRAMQNSLVNLDIVGNFTQAVAELGFKLEDLYEQEPDPALGNGGLGRLAACFLDSMATLDYAAWGYGIRYNYGIFEQRIVNGHQVEHPDYWLTFGNPWEIERKDVSYPIKFYGHVKKYQDEKGRERYTWEGGETIQAVAYDTPIPGFDTYNVNNLRLWKAGPAKEFDFAAFNEADYDRAVEARQRAEYITSVLYPNDSTYAGKELRLKQQYFFVSATVQDVVRRFKKKPRSWSELPDKIAIQLNDTHPAIAIAELMRVLVDVEGLDWDVAWNLTTQVFAYTNHTVLPEALEKWSVELLGNLLPRHLDIIYLINHKFLEAARRKFGDDGVRQQRLSLIEESTPKMIRMANLAIVGSHAVNGVAALHTDLIKASIFKDFFELWPSKFQNKTNGVTPRRWIHCANPLLSDLISRTLGSDEWLKNLDLLQNLRAHADDEAVQTEWRAVKLHCKEKLAAWVKKSCKVNIDPNSLFDVQVKRIHEYKRQLLNALYVIYRYNLIKKTPAHDRHQFVPRVVLIGGKAAPGYVIAKKIIKLVNNIADRVNNDAEIGNLLKVVFLPNYNVSNAQVIIPASDISQHISTAGTEASGTSNMKFAMNGGLIIGTMDGANVEMAEEMGEENMFIFGARAHEVANLRAQVRATPEKYVGSRLKTVFDLIRSGQFGDVREMGVLVDNLCNGNDHYLLCADFYSYLDAQERVDREWKDTHAWTRKSIISTASMGKFSTDRTIKEYAEQIWNLQPFPRPSPNQMPRVRSFPNFDPNKMVTTETATASSAAAPAAESNGKKNKKK